MNVEFGEGWYQTYTGIDRVVSYLGASDDTLDATLEDVVIEVYGQDGNDTIKAGSASGIHGGEGDTLVGSVNRSLVWRCR